MGRTTERTTDRSAERLKAENARLRRLARKMWLDMVEDPPLRRLLGVRLL